MPETSDSDHTGEERRHSPSIEADPGHMAAHIARHWQSANETTMGTAPRDIARALAIAANICAQVTRLAGDTPGYAEINGAVRAIRFIEAPDAARPAELDIRFGTP